MAVRVKLSDGVEFVLHSSLDEFRKAVRLALDNNQVLEVENGDGKTRLINPLQIVFFEEVEDDEASQAVEAAAATGHR